MNTNIVALLIILGVVIITSVAALADSYNREITKQTCFTNATSETQFLSCKELK